MATGRTPAGGRLHIPHDARVCVRCLRTAADGARFWLKRRGRRGFRPVCAECEARRLAARRARLREGGER